MYVCMYVGTHTCIYALVSSSFSCVIVVATAFFVGRFFLKQSLSFRRACTRCCGLGISVVMEHSPVVAGSDADSEAGAPDVVTSDVDSDATVPAELPPSLNASSQIAQGATTDRITAGRQRAIELRNAFTRYDKDGTETIATKNLGSVVRWLFYDPTDAALQIMINKADPKGTGKIGLFMFILLMTGKLDDEGRPMKRQRTD